MELQEKCARFRYKPETRDSREYNSLLDEINAVFMSGKKVEAKELLDLLEDTRSVTDKLSSIGIDEDYANHRYSTTVTKIAVKDEADLLLEGRVSQQEYRDSMAKGGTFIDGMLYALKASLPKCTTVYEIRNALNRSFITAEAEDMFKQQIEYLRTHKLTNDVEADALIDDLAEKAVNDCLNVKHYIDKRLEVRKGRETENASTANFEKQVVKKLSKNSVIQQIRDAHKPALTEFRGCKVLWKTSHTICYQTGEYPEEMQPILSLLGIPNTIFKLYNVPSRVESEEFEYKGVFLNMIPDHIGKEISNEYIILLFYRYQGSLGEISKNSGVVPHTIKNVLYAKNAKIFKWRDAN